MCSPVERYVCFDFIFFLYEIDDVPKKKYPGKVVFGVVFS